MTDTPDLPSDVWSEWLLHVRYGDDPAFAEIVCGEVERYAVYLNATKPLA